MAKPKPPHIQEIDDWIDKWVILPISDAWVAFEEETDEAEMYKADRKRSRVEARVALRLRKKLLQSYNTKRTKNKQRK